MDVSSGDYYRRLRVSRTASRQEIKTAFRRLARQYHPDLHPNEPDAAARFKALREAYEVLIDRVRRQRYDQRAGGPPDDYWPSEEEHSAQHNSTPDLSTPDHSTRERSAKDNSAPAQPTDFYIRGIRHAIAHRYAAA
ncbi:MAG: DnaJ domain-containing protein, partial [Cyanobacteria bacterium J06650_10]